MESIRAPNRFRVPVQNKSLLKVHPTDGGTSSEWIDPGERGPRFEPRFEPAKLAATLRVPEST